jgi:hypothetical protein
MKKTLVCAALVVISIFAGRVIKARAGTSATPHNNDLLRLAQFRKNSAYLKAVWPAFFMFEDASANIFAVECPALAPGPAEVRFIVHRN